MTINGTKPDLIIIDDVIYADPADKQKLFDAFDRAIFNLTSPKVESDISAYIKPLRQKAQWKTDKGKFGFKRK